MASLSSPTITIAITTTSHTPFLPKSPQLRSFKSRTHTLLPSSSSSPKTNNNNIVVSCKAQNNNNNNDTTTVPWHLDRRNMLIGLGGMYGAAITSGGDALAEPLAPDMQSCTLTDANWDNSVGDRCCPPTVDPERLSDFKFENYADPVMKVRRPAHLAMQDPEWLEDYKRATALMKSLPMSDPRSFLQQARVHCAYCDGAYPVLGFPETRLEIHGSWLFAPFHRWYMYFFERIMAKLINKPGFAMPYWNWDHPDGMRMPEMFKDINSPLFNPNRNPVHMDKVMDLSFSVANVESDFPEQKQIDENLLLIRKHMLYPSKPDVFFGEEYRGGNKATSRSGAGALETAPHNNVHLWTGSTTLWSRQDMGAFWSAGRDAAFYCHHANVDRMWYLWRKELPGSRKDLTDPDYLNTSFVFYDENANPVRVYVKDSFDIEKLGYKYEQQDLPWLSKKASAPAAKPAVASIKVVTFPRKLDSVITTKVVRPQTSRTSDEKEEQEEVLLIDLDVGMASDVIKFDVYINDDYKHVPGEKTMVSTNFAQSFSMLVHNGKGGATMMMPKRKNRMKIPLNKLLEDIDASDDDAIKVTIVPNSGTENIDITDLTIKFASN